jgi:hypothetical protein
MAYQLFASKITEIAIPFTGCSSTYVMNYFDVFDDVFDLFDGAFITLTIAIYSNADETPR